MSLSESGRHSREFMLKAVERLEAGERASALAIELNLQRTIIYHWRDRFRANGAEALTSKRGRPRTPEVLAAEGVRAQGGRRPLKAAEHAPQRRRSGGANQTQRALPAPPTPSAFLRRRLRAE